MTQPCIIWPFALGRAGFSPHEAAVCDLQPLAQHDSIRVSSLAHKREGGERRLAVLLDDHALPNVGYPTTIRT